MINMHGFTLGFFFPKQDVVRSAMDTQTATRQETREARTIVTSLASDDAADRPAPLSLYAYRFF